MAQPEASSDSLSGLINKKICVACETYFQDSNPDDSDNYTCGSCREYINENNGKICGCGVCDRVFEEYVTLDIHMKSHPIDVHFICEQCGRYYLAAVDRTSPGQNICRECGKGAKGVAYFYFDSKEDSKEEYECSKCHERSELRPISSHLWLHARSQPYVCYICTEEFIVYRSFKRHVKFHFENHTPAIVAALGQQNVP